LTKIQTYSNKLIGTEINASDGTRSKFKVVMEYKLKTALERAEAYTT